MAPSPRDSFDSVAEQYQRARPAYPAVLLDALTSRTGVGPASRVLEIGPGTGQATADLLARGLQVTAVERGPGLSAVLDRELGSPALAVITADFDECSLPPGSFDLVTSFTAWHWLDPHVRTVKTARALRPGGWLATVTTTHVVDEADGFFEEMRACYQQWMGTDARRPLRSSEVLDDVDEVDDSLWFEPAERHRFSQDVVYSAEAFVDVLGTYSNHLALPERDRTRLFDCLSALMTERFGGRITKRYQYELRLAHRIARI